MYQTPRWSKNTHEDEAGIHKVEPLNIIIVIRIRTFVPNALLLPGRFILEGWRKYIEVEVELYLLVIFYGVFPEKTMLFLLGKILTSCGILAGADPSAQSSVLASALASAVAPGPVRSRRLCAGGLAPGPVRSRRLCAGARSDRSGPVWPGRRSGPVKAQARLY